MIEQQIIEYLQQQSKGVIKLGFNDARHIVNMVIGKHNKGVGAIAILHKIDGQTKVPVVLRTIYTTDEMIKTAIIKALDQNPDHSFYMYKCFNSLGEFEGHVYSTNPNIF